MTFFNWVITLGIVSILYFIVTFSWLVRDERKTEKEGKSKKREAISCVLFIGAFVVGLNFAIMCASVVNITLTCYLDDNRYGSVTNINNTVSDYYNTFNIDMHDSLEERNQLSNRGYWDKVESSVNQKELRPSEFFVSLIGSNRYLNYSWIENTSYYHVKGKYIKDSCKLSNYVCFEGKASYIVLDKFIVYTDEGKDLELKDNELYTIEYDEESVVSIDGIDYYNKAIIKKGAVS